MKRLEDREFWPELIEVKDDLSLRELGERFGVTPGAISAALKRTGIKREHAPPGPRAYRKKAPAQKTRRKRPAAASEELPPEKGSAPSETLAARGSKSEAQIEGYREPRTGNGTMYAWQITFRKGDHAVERVIVASDAVDAAREACRAGYLGEVVGVQLTGQMLG